jgi:hypothetical protein
VEVDVEVQDVELVGLAADELDHAGVGGVVDLEVAHEAGGGVAGGDEFGRGAAVAGGEEGDVVAEGDERFGKPMDDALGAAVAQRRDGLEERGDLRDAHGGGTLGARKTRVFARECGSIAGASPNRRGAVPWFCRIAVVKPDRLKTADRSAARDRCDQPA